MTVLALVPPMETVAELEEFLASLDGIPARRVLLMPRPGTATEADLLRLAEAPRKRLCELVDGVLVEKTVGFRESVLAMLLGRILGNFVAEHRLGVVSGEQGMVRLAPGLVRIPDVAFVGWSRFPDGRIPDDPVPDLAPDLAVEILSVSNTAEEMQRKRRDYFSAGVLLVWEVDPHARTVAVYTEPEAARILGIGDILEGGAVLPGFALPLAEFFAELDARA